MEERTRFFDFWLERSIGFNYDFEEGKLLTERFYEYELWAFRPISKKNKEPIYSIIEGIISIKEKVIENFRSNSYGGLVITFPEEDPNLKKRFFKINKDVASNGYYITEIINKGTKEEEEVGMGVNPISKPTTALINFLTSIDESELLEMSEMTIFFNY